MYFGRLMNNWANTFGFDDGPDEEDDTRNWDADSFGRNQMAGREMNQKRKKHMKSLVSIPALAAEHDLDTTSSNTRLDTVPDTRHGTSIERAPQATPDSKASTCDNGERNVVNCTRAGIEDDESLPPSYTAKTQVVVLTECEWEIDDPQKCLLTFKNNSVLDNPGGWSTSSLGWRREKRKREEIDSRRPMEGSDLWGVSLYPSFTAGAFSLLHCFDDPLAVSPTSMPNAGHENNEIYGLISKAELKRDHTARCRAVECNRDWYRSELGGHCVLLESARRAESYYRTLKERTAVIISDILVREICDCLLGQVARATRNGPVIWTKSLRLVGLLDIICSQSSLVP
ncbi:10993_t:CDS:2 [Acaulospora colombiana]|uniref:10993_t:CDS:1 n=1 Tax=Acaulospora colombiana TaxID=27376 RepID=A0ACA9N6X9_9GLOM|nr:10993_t:CDS:2 [Acaulospora colombiana]